MRTRPQIPTWRRNLSRRLPKPAEGNGRVQRACRRALLVHGTASTSDVIAWAYAQRSASERLQSRCQARPGGDWRGQGWQDQDNWPAAPVVLAECGWTLREKGSALVSWPALASA